jgi:hypothetical protein
MGVGTTVARAQNDSLAASELMKKLTEKERQRNFKSTRLNDPRLKTKEKYPTYRKKGISGDDRSIGYFSPPKDNEARKGSDMQQVKKGKFSTFSLAIKRPVIVTAAAFVIGRSLLSVVGKGVFL